MNILEALHAVREGNLVKVSMRTEMDTYYIFQTILQPFGTTALCEVSLESASSQDDMPKKWSDLDHDELTRICIEALDIDDYEVISYEQMFKEIQTAWKEKQ